MCKTGVTAAQASHPQKTTENGLMIFWIFTEYQQWCGTDASDKSIQPFNIKKRSVLLFYIFARFVN